MRLSKQELFLLTFFLVFKRIEGRKRLQKLIFLISRKYHQQIPFSYEPYFYGPYSSELQGCVEQLVSLGLIQESKSTNGRVEQFTYELTGKGMLISKLVEKQTLLEAIFNKLFEDYSGKPTTEIVSEVYAIAGITH